MDIRFLFITYAFYLSNVIQFLLEVIEVRKLQRHTYNSYVHFLHLDDTQNVEWIVRGVQNLAMHTVFNSHTERFKSCHVWSPLEKGDL